MLHSVCHQSFKNISTFVPCSKKTYKRWYRIIVKNFWYKSYTKKALFNIHIALTNCCGISRHIFIKSHYIFYTLKVHIIIFFTTSNTLSDISGNKNIFLPFRMKLYLLEIGWDYWQKNDIKARLLL